MDFFAEDGSPSSIGHEVSIPDGIGLSLDEVRALLAKKHETIVAQDDPVLLLVTLLNAYVHEFEKLLDKHNKATVKVMGSATKDTIKALEDEARCFAMDFKDKSIENTLATIRTHQAAMNEFLTIMHGICQQTKTYAYVIVGASIFLSCLTLARVLL